MNRRKPDGDPRHCANKKCGALLMRRSGEPYRAFMKRRHCGHRCRYAAMVGVPRPKLPRPAKAPSKRPWLQKYKTLRAQGICTVCHCEPARKKKDGSIAATCEGCGEIHRQNTRRRAQTRAAA